MEVKSIIKNGQKNGNLGSRRAAVAGLIEKQQPKKATRKQAKKMIQENYYIFLMTRSHVRVNFNE